MAGTRAGGLKAAATNKKKYGDGTNGKENFYSAIGRKGGKLSTGGGFKRGSELAREAGRKGGLVSRRNKSDY